MTWACGNFYLPIHVSGKYTHPYSFWYVCVYIVCLNIHSADLKQLSKLPMCRWFTTTKNITLHQNWPQIVFWGRVSAVTYQVMCKFFAPDLHMSSCEAQSCHHQLRDCPDWSISQERLRCGRPVTICGSPVLTGLTEWQSISWCIPSGHGGSGQGC